MSAWVTQIAANEALSRLRQRVASVEIEGLAVRSQGNCGGSLWRRSGVCPHSTGLVFLLRECDELDTAEALACLGLTAECVKTRLHRAKALLRDRLRGHLETAGRGPRSSHRPAMPVARLAGLRPRG